MNRASSSSDKNETTKVQWYNNNLPGGHLENFTLILAVLPVWVWAAQTFPYRARRWVITLHKEKDIWCLDSNESFLCFLLPYLSFFCVRPSQWARLKALESHSSGQNRLPGWRERKREASSERGWGRTNRERTFLRMPFLLKDVVSYPKDKSRSR